jgi:hypothetical protein
MFESDEKKYLRKKYDRLHSPRSQSKRQPTQHEELGKPKTVYGELKLSEQLAFQLDELKQRFDNLREQLEYTTYQRDTCQKELTTIHQKYHERGDIIKTMKKDSNQMKKTMSECILKCF